MAIFHLLRKDLVILTKKQGAPRGKNQTAILRYTEHLKTLDEKADWPFPPILVIAQTKLHKKDNVEKPTGKWVVIGGMQRVTAANNVKWDRPIPAEVFTGQENPEDRWAGSAYVASVRDNMKHGTPFTTSERTESFKEMRKLGMTVEEIANEWHVHKSTVSRDLRGLTTQDARDKAAGKETATETAEQPTDGAKPKGNQDVKHFCDFLKARYDDIFEYLSGTDEAAEEYKAYVFRLAEALNG